MNTYILVANASVAHLYSCQNLRSSQFEPLKDFAHPGSRKKGHDLVTDKQGRYKGPNAERSAFQEHTDPKEVEADHFALQLAKELDSRRTKNEFQRLLIVTPAHFQGLLKNHLSPQTQKLMDTIAKDYTQSPTDELVSHIHNQLELT